MKKISKNLIKDENRTKQLLQIHLNAKKPQKDKEHLMTLDEEDFIPRRTAKSKPKPRRSNFKLKQKTEEQRPNKNAHKQVRNIEKTQTDKQSDKNKKPKKINVSPSSKIKLKSLGYPENGTIKVCFLCGKNNHYSGECHKYPQTSCTETPCNKCSLYHDSQICKESKGEFVRN